MRDQGQCTAHFCTVKEGESYKISNISTVLYKFMQKYSLNKEVGKSHLKVMKSEMSNL